MPAAKTHQLGNGIDSACRAALVNNVSMLP